MKKTAALLLALVASASWAQTYVRPHITHDGTFVQGHMRTSPDSSNLNNWSTQGNANPYTGQSGTVAPNYAPAYTPPVYQAPQPTFGQQCGYTAGGRYVCR